MDVNGLITELQELAGSHPYLLLALLLFLVGTLVSGRASIVFYVLGFLALLQEFSLFDVFVSFLKSLPDKISSFVGGV